MLLIVAALHKRELARLFREALALDLDVLVEVHAEDELETRSRWSTPTSSASTTATSPTSRVDLDTHLRAARRRARGQDRRLGVGLSRRREQLDELERVGVDAVLVGETLMRAPDIEGACRALAGPLEDEEIFRSA